jgi:hypothetical protein
MGQNINLFSDNRKNIEETIAFGRTKPELETIIGQNQPTRWGRVRID